jgi:hypothetical protein
MIHQKIIKKGDKIIAMVFKKDSHLKGSVFLTPSQYTLQLGVLQHAKGIVLRDHRHNPKIKYNVDTTQEFLYIEKGKVKVKFFDNDWNLVDEEILSAGDFMLHVSGGHGFEILEDIKMIEVKQGPYPGDKSAKIYRDE